jgi:hypothetical protein
MELSAQSFIPDSAFIRFIDLPAAEPFDTSESSKKVKYPHIYLASRMDVYSVFGYAMSARFQDFDFDSTHILGKQECWDCKLICEHEQGEANCHRNRCTYSWKWSVRDNKKAFTEIPFTNISGHTGPGITKHVYRDTVINHPSDSGIHRWYTMTRGDRFARFYFKLYSDNYYPVVVLKVFIRYGGSRASGSWDNTILFRKPEKVSQFTKNTIRVK